MSFIKSSWGLFALSIAPLILGLLIALFPVYRLERAFQTTGQELVSSARRLNLAKDVRYNLKMQVQEWKDVLLRGSNPADLKHYTEAFRERHRRVQELSAALEGELGSPQLRATNSDFRAAYADMGRRYEYALQRFAADGGQDPFVVDRQVRGMDRAPTALLDRIVAELETRHAELEREVEAGFARQWTQNRIVVAASILASLILAGLVALLARSQARLGRSRATLQLIFNTTPIGLQLKDLQGQVLMVNSAMSRNLMSSPGELVGTIAHEWSHLSEIPEDERRRILETDAAVVATGKPVEFVIERMTRAGARTQRVIKSPVVDPGGQVMSLLSVVEDVTEKAKAESAVRQSQRLLEAVINILPHGLFVKDAEGRYILANTSHAEYFGLTPEAMRGMRTEQLPSTNPELNELWREEDRRVLERGEPLDLEAQAAQAATGEVVWSHKRKYPLRDEAGSVIGVVGLYENITEQRRAGEAVQASQRLLQMVVDTLPHAVSVKDPQGRFMLVNRIKAEMIGRPAEALYGKTVDECGLADVAVLQATQRLEKEVLATGATATIDEFETTGSAGSSLILKLVQRPLVQGNGHLEGTVGFAIDITPEVAAKRQAQLAHARLMDAIESIPAGFQYYDADNRLVLINSQSKRNWPGIADVLVPGTPGEVILRAIAERVERLSGAVLEARIAKMQGEITSTGGSRTIRTGDGRVIRLMQNKVPSGGVMVVGLDVTEDERRSEELQAAHARLSDAIESFPGGIVIWDEKDRLLLWNSKWQEAQRGIKDEIKVGATIEHLTRLAVRWETALHGDAYEEEVQYRLREFHNAPSTSRRQIPGGRTYRLSRTRLGGGGLIVVWLDVTDAERRDQELHQAQKIDALGQLTGGVAHDFNNLLTVILGNAQVLKRMLGDREQLMGSAAMIEGAAQRASELTRRLLAFARRQVLQPVELDLNQVTGNMEGLLRRTIGEDIELEFVQGGGLWKTLADPSQVESTLLNLAVNARDAMPGGGKLTLETANVRLDDAYAAMHQEVIPGQYVMLSVSDTGSGMPVDVLARAFDPFFTTKGPGKGTGMGLAMIHGFVKQSGGHVKIYSELEHGTSVKVYLPRALITRQEAEEAILSTALDTVPTGSETVLVVEDEEWVRINAVRELKGLGYRILQASDPRQALSVLAEQGPVDLLFTDVIMPGGMNGKQLAEAALSLHPDMSVLYTSGYSENVILHHGKLDPGIHLLNKPYGQADLARKVRQVLDMAHPKN